MSGGSGGGGGPAAETYPVPWKVRDAKDSAGEGTRALLVPGLEGRNQEIEFAHVAHTFALRVAVRLDGVGRRGARPNADKLLGESKLPVAVLATPDGTLGHQS